MTSQERDNKADFLSGGGEMGRLIRAFDWSRTSLGPLDCWSSAVTTTVGLILGSSVPIVTSWGDEGIMIYNDAYAVVAGGRHPGLLGLPLREGWPELAGFNDRVMKMVLAGGALSYRDQEMTLYRSGEAEQVWLNLDYSPVLDETGTPIGVISIVVETTARILAERELKLEEAQREAERERQRRLFEQAPGFVTVMRGPDHVVEFVNEAHRALFNSGDWLGKSAREAIPSIEGQGFFDMLDQVYTTGKTIEVESVPIVYQRSPDATPEHRYITLMYSPAYDDAGIVDGVFCLGFEVTEITRAVKRRTALAVLGDRIREIDDPFELAFAAAEVAGQQLGGSRAGYGLIDPVAETITIERDWFLPGLPSLAGVIAYRDYGSFIENLHRNEMVIVNDTRADPRTQGHSQQLEAIQARAFVNLPVMEHGKLVAVLYVDDDKPRVWSAEELTFLQEVAERTRTAVERRRAEESLRENEARLRFLDALGKETARYPDADSILKVTTRMVGEALGISVCAYADMDEDQDGFTIRGDWAAPEAQSIVGHYSLAAFGALAVEKMRAGEPLILDDNASQLPPEAAATFLRIGLAATICLPLVRDGRLTALMAIHDSKPRHWTAADLALLTEVTERSWSHIERVRLETSKRDSEQRFLAELEAKVAERTAALQQAQKMEAIGQLTGGVAHDFNNLLMAVSGSVELLRKRVPNDPGLHKLIDNALEATRRGSSLTRRMLAFARRQELQSKRTDLADLVAGMTELLSRSLGPMIVIEAQFPEALAPVEIDPNQLESALLNLMVNARDAMDGEGRVIISGREEDVRAGDATLKPGRYVCLAVTDTGEGMDDATLKRATEPFFTTKGVGKGTGLGLSMVLGFAEQSGGTLKLRSRLGEGTTAEIWLRAAGAMQQVQTEPPEADEPLPAAPRRLQILAVDDDALVLMNTVAMLEDLGHEVTSAYSAREALEAMRSREFDLVVTDHAMPQMTGAQLAGEIRDKSPSLPIVLATGYAELPPGPGQTLPRLSKPFSLADLAAAVNRATAFRSGVA